MEGTQRRTERTLCHSGRAGFAKEVPVTAGVWSRRFVDNGPSDGREVPPPFAPLSILLTFFIQHSFILQIFIQHLYVPSLGSEATHANNRDAP